MPCRRLDGWIREYAGCKPVDGNYPAGGGSAFAGGFEDGGTDGGESAVFAATTCAVSV